MTLAEFEALIVTVDPTLTKWKGPGTGNYTVWSIGGLANGLMSDDEPDEIDHRVYVDRFTKSDSDAIADALEAAFSNAFIPFEHEQMYEESSKYIHHSFTCIVE